MSYKIGDRVNYLGTRTHQTPQKDCIIEQIELRGSIFNTDMATLDKVVCWVSFHELVKIKEKSDV